MASGDTYIEPPLKKKAMKVEEFDFDNFIFIGFKIEQGIFDIPREDREYFMNAKQLIIDSLACFKLVDNSI